MIKFILFTGDPKIYFGTTADYLLLFVVRYRYNLAQTTILYSLLFYLSYYTNIVISEKLT